MIYSSFCSSGIDTIQLLYKKFCLPNYELMQYFTQPTGRRHHTKATTKHPNCPYHIWPWPIAEEAFGKGHEIAMIPLPFSFFFLWGGGVNVNVWPDKPCISYMTLPFTIKKTQWRNLSWTLLQGRFSGFLAMFAANLQTAKWQDTPWKTGVHVRWYLFKACIICTLYIF